MTTSLNQEILKQLNCKQIGLKRVFTIDNFAKSVVELDQLHLLTSLYHLMDGWRDKVSVYSNSIGDESSSVDMNCLEAKSAYQEGRSLLFNDIDRYSDELRNLCLKLRQELFLPGMTYGRSLVYATPAGFGTSMHFDQNINFVIQLSGEKEWLLADNESVKHPLTRHAVSEVMDNELASYCAHEMPIKMPSHAQKITLKPGSLLFVPAGIWHQTKAISDSLSLNFTYSVPSWLDLTLAALRSRLVMRESWRENVRFNDDSMCEEQLAMLLKEAQNELASWDAKELTQVFK